VVVDAHYGTADQDYKVGYREAIASAIPSLIQLLQDEKESVRWNAVEVIAKLANHGER
jgi:hypothetical protein